MMYADGHSDQAARQVFARLRIGFTAAPILFGIDTLPTRLAWAGAASQRARARNADFAPASPAIRV
jgi:hypothetical protein